MTGDGRTKITVKVGKDYHLVATRGEYIVEVLTTTSGREIVEVIRKYGFTPSQPYRTYIYFDDGVDMLLSYGGYDK